MIDTILAFIAAYNATHLLPIIFPITCAFALAVFPACMVMVVIKRSEATDAARKATEHEERVQRTLAHIDYLYTAVAREKSNRGSDSWITVLERDTYRNLGRLETLVGHEQCIQLLKTLSK